MKLSPFSCYFGKSFDVLGLELMSVTCREDAFSPFMGPQQYFFLSKWLSFRSHTVVGFQSIKTAWGPGVVRRASS